MQDPASTTATIDSKDFTACRRYEVRSRFRVQQPLRVVVNDHSDRSVTALLDHLKSAVGSDANEVAVGHVVRKERDAAELEGLVVFCACPDLFVASLRRHIDIEAMDVIGSFSSDRVGVRHDFWLAGPP